MEPNIRGFGLRSRFEALRAAILSYIATGTPDSDRRIVQARQQQRVIAEKMVRLGLAKGIAFEREGDLHPIQRRLARVFGRLARPRPQELIDAEKTIGEKPPDVVIRLKTLYFHGETGELQIITPPPSQIVGLEALRIEGKVGSIMGRTLSALEGNMGVDYVIDKDPESGITFYVPIGGDDG